MYDLYCVLVHDRTQPWACGDVFWLGPPQHQNVLGSDSKTHLESRVCAILIYILLISAGRRRCRDNRDPAWASQAGAAGDGCLPAAVCHAGQTCIGMHGHR